MFAPICLFGEGLDFHDCSRMEARANIFFAAALGLCALCTHKSPRRVRFRANRTSSRHRRMTESDVVDGARSQQRGAIG
jgi:hypothetical protein